jgi:ABC-2 type transport system ATP-binding protein
VSGAPAAAPAITVRGLRVVRGGLPVLDGIDLDIPAGCVYGLVGPSGSGKTTLIRSITGLQRIAAGEINVLGLQAGSAELRRRLGYMPQEVAIYSDLTARENLAFFAAVYRVSPLRVAEVLRLIDMDDVADRPVTTYAGGQRRRVALGAALLAEPPLLILDEPTVGLDPRLRHRIWTQFKAWATAGTTLLVSTHVMDEAAHTDRLAFIVDGRIVADGTPEEMLAQTGTTSLEEAVLALTTAGEPV